MIHTNLSERAIQRRIKYGSLLAPETPGLFIDKNEIAQGEKLTASQELVDKKVVEIPSGRTSGNYESNQSVIPDCSSFEIWADFENEDTLDFDNLDIEENSGLAQYMEKASPSRQSIKDTNPFIKYKNLQRSSEGTFFDSKNPFSSSSRLGPLEKPAQLEPTVSQSLFGQLPNDQEEVESPISGLQPPEELRLSTCRSLSCHSECSKSEFYNLIKKKQYSSFDSPDNNRFILQIRQGLGLVSKIVAAKQVSPCRPLQRSFGYPELKPKVVLIDLDETLVHADPYRLGETYDGVIRVEISNEYSETYGILIRPYVTEFLQALSETCSLFAFTASIRPYAEQVVELLDPERRYIKGIFSREDCEKVGACYVKSLRQFSEVDPSNILIIDNLVQSFALDLKNGIPIKPFYFDKDDEELLTLSRYMSKKYIDKHSNLVEFVASTFNFQEFYRALLEESEFAPYRATQKRF